ncbi:hypothetical protein C0989_003943 [Termitomyces sp. Mn162]|nr:hypothetical protein C0989_003943 [Termitomyces sp. Mn162]
MEVNHISAGWYESSCTHSEHRATVVNGLVSSGQNVLITGIGGGVALIALQICIAKGASVYVTSGSDNKIQKAIALGAKGGVNYKDKEWPAQLGALLGKGKELDVVIDSGGGEIMMQTSKILKHGGRVVCYGMYDDNHFLYAATPEFIVFRTASPKITFTMREVLKNLRLIGTYKPQRLCLPFLISINSGSTMGSHQDLIDATDFLAEHHIIPVISHIFEGLESAEQGFETMKKGEQFGKIVVKIAPDIDTPVKTKL